MMKRTVLAIAVLVLAGSIAFGQSTQVLSRNAVGYVKATVSNNVWKLVSPQFENLDGSDILIPDILGDSGLPDGTIAYLFDVGSGLYVQESYIAGLGWLPGTNKLWRGDGLWVKTPGTTNVYIMGEVPDTTQSVVFVAGYQIFSYPFPAETYLTNTDLQNIASDGDIIYSFNGATYDQASFILGLGWLPQTFMLRPGESYWYNAGSGFTWNEVKPYTWP